MNKELCELHNLYNKHSFTSKHTFANNTMILKGLAHITPYYYKMGICSCGALIIDIAGTVFSYSKSEEPIHYKSFVFKNNKSEMYIQEPILRQAMNSLMNGALKKALAKILD